ncbi:hypothetical protein [Caldivirga sp.]|uniref:hypothetical protein n=1 Tax=Caldivirga sp. TaxID=2080243 RepID=UPI0025C23571|nr:hypothetical protein [Caldivirga sp.]
MSQGEGEKKPEEKPKLLIPSFLRPDAYVKEEKKGARERRLRVRRSNDVEEGKAMLNPQVASELGITNRVELVLVGGGSRERRYVMNAVVNDRVPKGEVWCNAEEMRRYGIADNSIATVRAPR